MTWKTKIFTNFDLKNHNFDQFWPYDWVLTWIELIGLSLIDQLIGFKQKYPSSARRWVLQRLRAYVSLSNSASISNLNLIASFCAYFCRIKTKKNKKNEKIKRNCCYRRPRQGKTVAIDLDLVTSWRYTRRSWRCRNTTLQPKSPNNLIYNAQINLTLILECSLRLVRRSSCFICFHLRHSFSVFGFFFCVPWKTKVGTL